MSVTETFIFICPACGYKARLPEQFAGRTIKCPGCQAPQVAVAPVNVQRKTATFTKVGATPMPFSLPQEQADALAAIPPATPIAPTPVVPVTPLPAKAFPSPLPGAIQITTDRVGRTSSTGDAAAIGSGSSTARLAKPAGALVDFTCTACQARLRLPAHYAGKSILCPKCSAPQQVTPASMEPMDTTRSLSQKAAESPLIANPPQQQQAPLGTGTGIRVRVTPLPQTYPTPLPTAAATPTPTAAVAPLTIIQTAAAKTQAAPDATPVATPVPVTAADADDALLTDLIDNEAAASPSQTFAKPHPSKSKSSPQRPVTARVVPPPVPPSPAPAKPVALIAILLVTVIALAASWAYHLVANGDSQAQLEQAQAAAKAASAREAEAAAKLAELTAKVGELERKLSEPAPVPAPAEAPVPAEAPAPSPAETTTPAPALVLEAPAAEAPIVPTPEPTSAAVPAEPQAATPPATPAEAATPAATIPAAEIPPAP